MVRGLKFWSSFFSNAMGMDTSLDSNKSKKSSYPIMEIRDSCVKEGPLKSEDKKRNDMEDLEEASLLNHLQKTSAVFKSQQMGEPDLSISDKREIAKYLLRKNPLNFLLRFGKYLEDNHLNYFLKKGETSYEVIHYVKTLKTSLGAPRRKLIKKNRRYEAMKRMESTGDYFSESEMEKREPLLYYQMVGQYLSEKEKISKNREAMKGVIPSFSTFLFDKMDRDELTESLRCQQEEEDKWKCEDELFNDPRDNSHSRRRWGDDWEGENVSGRIPCKQHGSKKNISKQEKEMLFKEFKSIMQSNFLNGQDYDFNYSDVDSNPDYDCLEIRTQDEEEKYFDEETCDGSICTDTGIVDY